METLKKKQKLKSKNSLIPNDLCMSNNQEIDMNELENRNFDENEENNEKDELIEKNVNQETQLIRKNTMKVDQFKLRRMSTFYTKQTKTPLSDRAMKNNSPNIFNREKDHVLNQFDDEIKKIEDSDIVLSRITSLRINIIIFS